MDNIEWLIKKVADDTRQFLPTVKNCSKSMTQIERYVKGEIWEYHDLVLIIEGIKNDKKVKM